jgi:hypothetical protein
MDKMVVEVELGRSEYAIADVSRLEKRQHLSFAREFHRPGAALPGGPDAE